MNSLTYLSKQFDVLAASSPPKQTKGPRLQRVQTWSATSFFFPQSRRSSGTSTSSSSTGSSGSTVKPAFKRVSSSPSRFFIDGIDGPSPSFGLSSSSSSSSSSSTTITQSTRASASPLSSGPPHSPQAAKSGSPIVPSPISVPGPSLSPSSSAKLSSSLPMRSRRTSIRGLFRRIFFVRIFILMWDAICAGWEALTLLRTASSATVDPHSSGLSAVSADVESSESEKVAEVKRQRPRKSYGALRRDRPPMTISVTAPDDCTSSSSEDDFGAQLNKPGYQYERHQHRLHIGRHHTDPTTSTLTTTATQTVPFSSYSPLDSQSLKPSSSRSSTPSSLISCTPPPSTRKSSIQMPKTLVLDLDETLIHSTSRPFPNYSSSFFSSRKNGGDSFFSPRSLFGSGKHRGKRGEGHVVEVMLGGKRTVYHVYKRPFVDFFLRTVSSWYTLVIFTASMQEYADPVIDWLDAGRGILAKRLFRDSCTQLPNGSYTKDLAVVEPDLARVCLIDNSPISYRVNESNGIPIEGWINDPSDEALLDLLPVLDSLRFTSDVRRVLGIRGFSISSS